MQHVRNKRLTLVFQDGTVTTATGILLKLTAREFGGN
jgi:hypothetical protein